MNFTSDIVVSCIPYERELGPFGAYILSKNLKRVCTVALWVDEVL